MNLIPLVEVGDLLSPCNRAGAETRPDGSPLHESECVPLSAWRPQWATPWAASILRRWDAAVRAEGGAALRVRRIGRPWEDQAAVRRAFDAWIAAGSPAPGSRGWVSSMSTAYAARPGESFHGFGAAVDLDRDVFEFPGLGRRTNASLERLWEIGADLGAAPIIAQARISQSEAWHFDLLGPVFEAIRAALRGQGQRDAGKWTAISGHVLTGKWRGDLGDWRYVQARLLLHFATETGATYPGVPDGLVGPKTRAALAVAVGDLPPRFAFSELVARLDEKKIAARFLGDAALAAPTL